MLQFAVCLFVNRFMSDLRGKVNSSKILQKI